MSSYTEAARSGRSATARRGLRRGRSRILALADLATIALAYAIAYAIADRIAAPAIDAPAGLLVALGVGAAALWLAVFTVYGLYERDSEQVTISTIHEVRELFHGLLAGSLLLLFVGQATVRLADARVLSPLEAVIFVAIALALVPLVRGAIRTWALPNVMEPRRTVIVGSGEAAARVDRKLRAHPEYGLDVIGFCDDAGDPAVELVGGLDDLPDVIARLRVEWVVLAAPTGGNERLLELMAGLPRADVKVCVVPQYGDVFAANAHLDDIEGMPIVSLPRARLSRSSLAVKRAFDVVVSAALLLLLAPLTAAIAVAIRLESRGPAIYRQPRRGRGGSVFSIAKFRTMVDGADRERQALAAANEMDGPLFKIAHDPRLTRVGRLLRKTSLDELPQLWNVLRGEMSLVGPRPFVLHEADQIAGWASRRLDIAPGITGLWQVLGRNDLGYEDMVKLDYLYVTGWSLWWDIEILCKTIPAVVRGKGAY